MQTELYCREPSKLFIYTLEKLLIIFLNTNSLTYLYKVFYRYLSNLPHLGLTMPRCVFVFCYLNSIAFCSILFYFVLFCYSQSCLYRSLFKSFWQKQSQELTSLNPDRNMFSINVELTSTFFLLNRGLVHHHHRVLNSFSVKMYHRQSI